MSGAPAAAPLGAVGGLSRLSGAQGGLPGGGDMGYVGRGSQADGTESRPAEVGQGPLESGFRLTLCCLWHG